VHALEVLRSEFEPGIPVVGTVPAIKPATVAARSVAIWATVATTESAYQRRLIAEFGGGTEVTPVACPGLASAVDAGDGEAIEAAIADAARRTPARCGALVLGCTEYELAADLIGAAVPDAILFGSAAAVASQALRRAVSALTLSGADSSEPPSGATDARIGTLTVLLSGRPASLPAAALQYRQGRELAQLDAGRDPTSGLAV
jgi:glutamate racemase